MATGERSCWEGDPESFSPDGLTEQLIDELLKEVDLAVAAAPRATSALLDGTTSERRYRRQARRAVAAVVRALPRPGAATGRDGWAA